MRVLSIPFRLRIFVQISFVSVGIHIDYRYLNVHEDQIIRLMLIHAAFHELVGLLAVFSDRDIFKGLASLDIRGK